MLADTYQTTDPTTFFLKLKCKGCARVMCYLLRMRIRYRAKDERDL